MVDDTGETVAAAAAERQKRKSGHHGSTAGGTVIQAGDRQRLRKCVKRRAAVHINDVVRIHRTAHNTAEVDVAGDHHAVANGYGTILNKRSSTCVAIKSISAGSTCSHKYV